MAYYPDLATKTQVTAGPQVRAVGWLSRNHPYPQGDVPPAVIERLQQFARLANDSTHALHWPKFMGSHTCELCRGGDTHRPEGYFNFGVPAGDLLYVAPELIVHYVEAHRYVPPPAFLAAVLNAPLPDTDAYRAAIQRFARSHGQ